MVTATFQGSGRRGFRKSGAHGAGRSERTLPTVLEWGRSYSTSAPSALAKGVAGRVFNGSLEQW